MFKNILIIITSLLLLGCKDGECIVTGNRLGSMGEPVTFEHDGKKYSVCCAPCIKKFKENPSKYINK